MWNSSLSQQLTGVVHWLAGGQGRGLVYRARIGLEECLGITQVRSHTNMHVYMCINILRIFLRYLLLLYFLRLSILYLRSWFNVVEHGSESSGFWLGIVRAVTLVYAIGHQQQD